MLNNSDNEDEGFVPNQIQIKHKSPKPSSKTSSPQKPRQTDVALSQTKIVKGEVLLWKEPSGVYQSFEECEMRSESDKKPMMIDRGRKGNKTHIQPKHPYLQYEMNSEYTLIFGRGRGQLFPLETNTLTKNQVNLSHILSQSDPYRPLKPFAFEPTNNPSEDLEIDSKFQSGNLYCAFKKQNSHQYILFIQNDTNTLGYNHWFYFSIKNAKPVYSLLKGRWGRGGGNIVYQDSPISDPTNPKTKYYCLSFQLQVERDKDYIMVAMNLPYSYSKLILTLSSLQAKARQQNPNLEIQTTSVCTSLCGNSVPELTITTNSTAKRAIILLARQHPGQTWSSFIMQGFLKELMLNSKSPYNQWLLDNFIFKIYPMINVDGVIYGNSRCDVSGVDLNRRWKQPSPNLHPQIYQLRKRISQLNKKYTIQCCLDLHGHSKDYNIFCYSCKTNLYSCRLLPYMIQNLNPIFYFPSCTFGISKYKETTARATIFREIKNQNVLTIQTSLYGFKDHTKSSDIVHFQPKHMYAMANSILMALMDFTNRESLKRSKIEEQIKYNIKHLQTYEQLTDLDSGSDSQPQLYQISFKTKAEKIFPKKFVTDQMFFAKNINRNKKNKITQDKDSSSSKEELSPQRSKIISCKSKITRKKIIPQKLQIMSSRQQRPLQKILIPNTDKRKASPKVKDNNTISYTRQQHYRKQKQQCQQSELSTNLQKSKQRSFFRRNRKMISIMPQPMAQRQDLSIDLKKSQKNNDSCSLDQDQRQRQEQMRQKLGRSQQNKQKFSHLLSLQQKIYNEDQNLLLNVLLNNKRMLELQKIRRNIEKSTGIAERQGKIRGGSNKKESIVDYRRFKVNEKVNIQIKRMIDKTPRYDMEARKNDFHQTKFDG